MNKNNIFQICREKIESWQSFQPLLFTSSNLWGLHIEIAGIMEQLFQHFWVDNHNLYRLSDDRESIKIDTIRPFIAKSYIRSNDRFQIFLIENISRFTLQSANACLKFFEEPGMGNIIFLTNSSTSWVLETILSRVENVALQSEKNIENDMFFAQLIQDFFEKKNNQLYTYFYFDKKREIQDYQKFFVSLLFFAQKYQLGDEILDEIEKNMNFLENTSIIPKYLLDKTLLLLEKSIS